MMLASFADYEAILEIAPSVPSSLLACRDALLQQAIRRPAIAEVPENLWISIRDNRVLSRFEERGCPVRLDSTRRLPVPYRD